MRLAEEDFANIARNADWVLGPEYEEEGSLVAKALALDITWLLAEQDYLLAERDWLIRALQSGAEQGESREIRAWCRLTLLERPE